MLNHDSANNKSKKLERGTKVTIRNQVKRNDVLEEDNPNTVTFPINIRVDNHIRNKIAALINLGLGKSQKDYVNNLVEQAIEELSASDRTRFEKMFEILEEKDKLKNRK